jgi:type I restriction enzyme S subunit
MLREVNHGATRDGINTTDLLAMPVAIPPRSAQRRIVEKIEELFSDLDAGVAALKRAKANLKRYRAAVLKAAVDGSLTAEWRAKHLVVEPAAKLLERILAERRRKWEADQLAKFKAAGKAPPKNWREKYAEPKPPDTTDRPELPKGWCWASVEQIGDVRLGRQRSPKNRSDKYPTKYLRAANITEGGLDITDVMDMDFQPREMESYRLHPGDILLSEASGSPDQVGKPVVWNGEIDDCCFQNTVIRLRPEGLPSDFPLTVFRCFYVNKVFAKVAAGVGINHLSAAKFSALPFPLAPLSEQREI